MIIGIEGTGSQSWQRMDIRRSFVRRVLDQTHIGPASYFIGPNNPGTDGAAIVEGAYQCLLNGASNKPVVLVGYSRGAAYCMYIAEKFHQEKRGWVDCLILFDAVARQADFDIPEKVPRGVRVCHHAYRDPAAGSRYFFGNVGLVAEDPRGTKFDKQPFFASHGALGGTWYDAADDEGKFGPDGLNGESYVDTNAGGAAFVTPDDRNKINVPHYPVTHIKQDQQGSDAAAKWMWERLKKEGVVPQAVSERNLAPDWKGQAVPGVRNVIR